MVRKTADDFDPGVLKLFDLYAHGLISRRSFLDRAAAFAVAGATASVLLDALNPNFAEARQIEPEDTRIAAVYLEIASPEGYGKVRGYLVRPAKLPQAVPAILVVHENRGLNPHIEDITRRLALEGFIAFAPDALYPLGGYPGDEDKARELFPKLDQAKTHSDFVAAARFLQSLPGTSGKVGATGFCYGGGIANYLATQIPDLGAAVSFYGSAPPAEDVKKIKAPLLLHYAGADDRVNAGWPAYETALKAAGVNYKAFIYPNVQHGFNNGTTPRYDAEAAKLAWQRTIEFFKETLKG